MPDDSERLVRRPRELSTARKLNGERSIRRSCQDCLGEVAEGRVHCDACRDYLRGDIGAAAWYARVVTPHMRMRGLP